jgi:hypothetical protein
MLKSPRIDSGSDKRALSSQKSNAALIAGVNKKHPNSESRVVAKPKTVPPSAFQQTLCGGSLSQSASAPLPHATSSNFSSLASSRPDAGLARPFSSW